MKTNKTLNVILVLIGVVIILMGLNLGLGGIRTLGWQISPDFIAVNDPAVFQVQDNHIRFIGGIWFGVGVVFVLGGFARARLQSVLVTLCLMIGVAGLFRFSAMDLGVLMSAQVAPSLVLELIGFPMLAWALVRFG